MLSYNPIEEAKNVLKIEADAINNLAENIDENFVKAIDLIYNCKNRLVLTGIGKAGIIARKIAATLASTGTPAFFMHPSEGLHGDLGMITADNIILAISHSGNSNEVLQLIPYFKHFKIPVISITANPKSELAKNSDIVLLTHVTKEACPMNLAPTTSTTVTLALGDALAVALINKRGFQAENFAIFHPSGALGKRLLIKVSDLMQTGERNPIIHNSKSFKEALIEMTSKGLGATSIIDDEGKLAGIITDGDLRRLLHAGKFNMDIPVTEVMIKTPKFTTPDTLSVKALDTMEQHNITVLPVLDEERHPVGMIHLHSIIKAGITT